MELTIQNKTNLLKHITLFNSALGLGDPLPLGCEVSFSSKELDLYDYTIFKHYLLQHPIVIDGFEIITSDKQFLRSPFLRIGKNKGMKGPATAIGHIPSDSTFMKDHYVDIKHPKHLKVLENGKRSAYIENCFYITEMSYWDIDLLPDTTISFNIEISKNKGIHNSFDRLTSTICKFPSL